MLLKEIASDSMEMPYPLKAGSCGVCFVDGTYLFCE